MNRSSQEKNSLSNNISYSLLFIHFFGPCLTNLLESNDDDGGEGEEGPEYLDSVGDVTEDDDLQH